MEGGEFFCHLLPWLEEPLEHDVQGEFQGGLPHSADGTTKSYAFVPN